MSALIKILKEWHEPWREYAIEFVGTFVFVTIATLTAYTSVFYSEISILEKSLIISFSYAALLWSTVNFSGGFLNPAITLALWLCQKVSGVKAVFFVLAQIVAALVSYYLVYILFSGVSPVEIFELGLGVDTGSAFVIEAVLSAFLIFVVFATMIDRRGPAGFGPLIVGLFLLSITLVAYPVTGAVFNPIAVIGNFIFSREYGNFLPQILGPLVGSIAGLVYTVVFIKPAKKK